MGEGGRVKYGSNAKLLFTDTDSLVYEVETDDVLWRFLWECKFCLILVIIQKTVDFMVLSIKNEKWS